MLTPENDLFIERVHFSVILKELFTFLSIFLKFHPRLDSQEGSIICKSACNNDPLSQGISVDN